MNQILQLTIEHITIVLSTIVLSTIIAVPSAIYIYKKNIHVNMVIQIVTLLQAFPTLAVFAILVPLLGIGKNVAILTLSLYAIMPIFLNTLNGFKTINPEYYEISRSLNLDKKTVLKEIEMPYVIIHIISGLRQATIYTISLATIATLIGAGGLGDLIYLGMQQLDIKLTLEGLIPLIVMAIIVNVLFNKLEQAMMPMDIKDLHEN